MTDAKEEFEPSPYASVASSQRITTPANQTKDADAPPPKHAPNESASALPSFVEETTPPAETAFVEETTPPAGIAKETVSKATSGDTPQPTNPLPKGLTSPPKEARQSTNPLPKGLTSLPKDATPQPNQPLPKGLTSLPKDATPQPNQPLPKGLTSLPKDVTPQPNQPLPKGLTSLPKDATPQPNQPLPKGLTSLPKDATPHPNQPLPKGLTSLPKDVTPLPTAPPSGILMGPPSGLQPSPQSTTTIDNPSSEEERDDDSYEFEVTGIVSSLDDAPKSQAQIRTKLPTKEKQKDVFIGKTLGARFSLHKKLGQGGMGAVYQATDQKTNDEVAVKILPMQLSTDQAVLDRFKRESRVQLSLEHPNIVRTVSAGQEDELGCFLAMELLKGQDFREFRIKTGRKKLTPPEILRFFDQLCAALYYTHKRGIVHRDLKPANVFLREAPSGPLDDVCLIDFGIAKLNSEDAQQLTVTGMFLGTPSYMSPEQAAGQTDIDHRSDIYSVGIMLYECLVGIPPFLSDNMVKILMDHLYTQPPPLTQMRPDMVFPPKLQKLIDRCLAKVRDKRPDAVTDISRELHEILDNVKFFEKDAEESFDAEEITARSLKPILEPEELRQEANKLLKGLGQPEIPNEPMPIEELFQRISKNLRVCEEPQVNLSELMMEVLLEGYSNEENAEAEIGEPAPADIFSQDGLSAVPPGGNAVPGNQTIGKMQILTIQGARRSSASNPSLPDLQAVPVVPQNTARPVHQTNDKILSLEELRQRHPNLSKTPDTMATRKSYQRKQPDFSKPGPLPQRGRSSGSRALLWLLLIAVAALAAIGLYLLQRGLSSTPSSPESRLPSAPFAKALKSTQTSSRKIAAQLQRKSSRNMRKSRIDHPVSLALGTAPSRQRSTDFEARHAK
ncbi:MAG: protein kinase [Myxococcales bacterium]|nr:protein kinase [Myxococcales bacterium]